MPMAVGSPFGIPLPGLQAHWTLGESSDGSASVPRLGSLANSPTTNPQRIDLSDATKIPSVSGLGGNLAASISGSKGFLITGNPKGAANNDKYFVGGSGSWLIVTRIFFPSAPENSFNTIAISSSNFTGGWQWYVSYSGGVAQLKAITNDVSLTPHTSNGPTITVGDWWTVAMSMDAETGTLSQFAIKSDGTELTTTDTSLSARDPNLLSTETTRISNPGSDAFIGYMQDLFFFKYQKGISPAGLSLIRQIHNSGTPLAFSAYSVPTPNSPEPSPAPFSNQVVTTNWLNTDTTNTQGLYYFRAYRMHSGDCRFFWSSDHAGSVQGPTGVGIFTATSSGPGTAPSTFTKISGIPLSGALLGYTNVDGIGTPTYRYQADDGTSEPHYIYLNYVIAPPPTGESDGESTFLFSSATEDFASVTARSVAIPAITKWNWTGYARIYDATDIPGLTSSYLAAYNSNEADTMPPSVTTSSDPKNFDVSDNQAFLDSSTAFPARIQIEYQQNIFTPDSGTRYYSVGRAAFPTGRGIGLVELQLVSGKPTPTGKIWQLGALDTDVFPTVGYTQEVMAFWESQKLYVYRLMGFYPPGFISPGISYEQIDLHVYDFPS